MRPRNVQVAVLCMALLVLAVAPGLAHTPRTNPSPENSAGTDSIFNSSWFLETIESANDVGQHVSIAIHSSNVPYMSYYDATNDDLRVAHYVGSEGNCGENNDWFCEVVDDGGASDDDVGEYSSIAMNPVTGHPAIAYHDTTNGALKYAWRLCYPTCHWITETVDLRPSLNRCSRGYWTSLAFAGDDSTPVISHYCAGLMGYGELRTAIADSSGDGNCGEGSAAGDWQCDVIESGTGIGKYTSVQADLWDSTLSVYISYYDGENGDLKLAGYSGPPPDKGVDGAIPAGNCGPGDTWDCVTIDSAGDVGRFTSLVMSGGIQIAYYDATNGALKFAEAGPMHTLGNCGPSGHWQCDTIDTMGTSSSPMGISLGQMDGYSIIAYQSISDEFSPGTLKVARPADTLGLPYGNCGPADPVFYSWQCDTIDHGGGGSNADEAGYTALAIHSSGLVTIAYHEDEDYLAGNLKVAYQRVQAFLPLVMR